MAEPSAEAPSSTSYERDETTSARLDRNYNELLSAALATGFLVAPVPFHRLVFGRRMKDDLIRAATRYVAAGLAFLLASITGATLLVLDFLLDRGVAVGVTSVIGVIITVLWVVLPLRARARSDVEGGSARSRGRA